MRPSAFFSSILVGSLSALLACTTTSTVGENPGDGTNPSGADPSTEGSSGTPGTPTPTPPQPTQPQQADTKGVVLVTVSAEQHLGSVNPITNEQPGLTAVRVVLRDQDVTDAMPTGAPGTCQTRLNNPGADADTHALALAFSANASAAGKSVKLDYDAKYRTLSGSFHPVLPDGTPITVTFGPEVPALAGKTITLPAATSMLADPIRKPAGGARELRGYVPGTDFQLNWSSVAGQKWILAADANIQPGKLVDCFPAVTATSFTVPASYMATVTQVTDASKQWPPVFVISRTEQVEQLGTIKVRKRSGSELFFQLNLVP